MSNRSPTAIIHTPQTRCVHSMLVKCWASVRDASPTLDQHRANVVWMLLVGASCRAQYYADGHARQPLFYISSIWIIFSINDCAIL